MADRVFRFFHLIRHSSGRRLLPSTISLSALGVAGLATDAGSARSETGLAFEFGLACVPHPDKVAKGGEDAYFFNHNLNSFGVADGVGAWSMMGIDPARFSRKLMRLTEYALVEDADDNEDKKHMMPTQALRVAYDGVCKLGIQGSCTALIGVLRQETLYLANLGDSGAMILAKNEDGVDQALMLDSKGFSSLSLSEREPDRQSLLESKHAASDDDESQSPLTRRGYEIVFKTHEQLHRFNCPFQLGIESSDSPEAASISQHTVKIGDLIIAGSDGLWDNLFDSDIQRLADESDDATELAYIIATAASRRASKIRGSKATPFAVNAAEAGVMFQGGKMDDITVIVAKVIPAYRKLPLTRSRL